MAQGCLFAEIFRVSDTFQGCGLHIAYIRCVQNVARPCTIVPNRSVLQLSKCTRDCFRAVCLTAVQLKLVAEYSLLNCRCQAQASSSLPYSADFSQAVVAGNCGVTCFHWM